MCLHIIEKRKKELLESIDGLEKIYGFGIHRSFSVLSPLTHICNVLGGFPSGSVVKNLPLMQDMRVRSLGQEDPLEEGMATHSSISCLENTMNRGAWWATVLRVAKSWT